MERPLKFILEDIVFGPLFLLTLLTCALRVEPGVGAPDLCTPAEATTIASLGCFVLSGVKYFNGYETSWKNIVLLPRKRTTKDPKRVLNEIFKSLLCLYISMRAQVNNVKRNNGPNTISSSMNFKGRSIVCPVSACCLYIFYLLTIHKFSHQLIKEKLYLIFTVMSEW